MANKSNSQQPDSSNGMFPISAWPNIWADAIEYGVDAAQRSCLFIDVLRKRGNQHMKSRSDPAPHVLIFDFDVIMDGRVLDRPVNYALVRIRPPDDVEIDEHNRPFIVIDPRAGHGPGIGGFKPDSEIGMAMRAGHPCYFVGFTPEPMPGQTIYDVCTAQAAFIAEVASRHPKADGKPVVIGNCQAGWQTLGTAAARPDLMGPIIIAGSPLSYWSGIDEKNPMGYLGGLVGGTWMASLWGDLGNGKFDGAWLVNNFEQLNPANTYWSKFHNLYANVDTEEERFLNFEKWWTAFYLLNTNEITTITNELFVGNKLSSGEITSPDGKVVDLRKIKSPIVCFCSWGDNITPPQQALHWISDLYDDADQIRARGQTIVYALHDTTGHLGIFVSGSVARKEHREFTNNIDLIDALPPGLYQAVLIKKSEAGEGAELASGDYVLRFEAREVDDIRTLGGASSNEERQFETVTRISEINEALYQTFWRPWVQAAINEQSAQWIRTLHPQRLPNQLLSDENPFMAPFAYWAKWVKENRQTVRDDNPFLAMQKQFSENMETMLNAYRDERDTMHQNIFETFYQSPLVQAWVGINPNKPLEDRGLRESDAFKAMIALKHDLALENMSVGGALEGLVRCLLFVAMGDRAVDERSFRALELINERLPEEQQITLQSFKQAVRDQFTLLTLNEEKALVSLPLLVGDEPAQRQRLFDIVNTVVSAQGRVSEEQSNRLRQIGELLDIDLGAVEPDGRKEIDAA